MDLNRIRAFEAKHYSTMLGIPWIAHSANVSVLSESDTLQNWLCNFGELKRWKYFGHIKRHSEKPTLEGIEAGKEAEASHSKDGRKTSQMSSEHRQRQAEQLEKDIDFAKKFGQRRPEQDMQIEEEVGGITWHRCCCSACKRQ